MPIPPLPDPPLTGSGFCIPSVIGTTLLLAIFVAPIHPSSAGRKQPVSAGSPGSVEAFPAESYPTAELLHPLLAVNDPRQLTKSSLGDGISAGAVICRERSCADSPLAALLAARNLLAAALVRCAGPAEG